MVRIPVPKTPKRAYNPDRPAGTLLQAQLKLLEWAARPAAERAPGKIEPAANLTEGEVAARVQALTKELHHKTLGRQPVIAPTATARKPRQGAKASGKRKRSRRRTQS